MATLVHGTTRYRAEQIIKNGPNPRYAEPGGLPVNDGFSMYVDGGPYAYRPPEFYARGKDSQCPNEGGPVILVVENVPDEVLSTADRFGLLPIRFGVVQFDYGEGFEELLAIWHSLPKTIRDV
jgi:hypothetical protein